MNLRNIFLPAGLAVLISGCVITPDTYPPGYTDNQYDEGYYDYRSTPSYEGYYYVRIIFIRNVPYYVDDDRYIRPIPPRMYDHFRNYPYDSLGHPPEFSDDREVRDGYPVSRIIYLNGVPYNVGNDRNAQPLPKRLQPYFRYTPPNQGNPAYGNRPQPPGQPDNGRNNAPPAFYQDRGADRNRDNRGPNEQDHGRMNQPPSDRGQSAGDRGAPADTRGWTPPPPEQRSQTLRQVQPNPNAGDSHPGSANGWVRDLNGNRPQTSDRPAKIKTDEKNADDNKSRGNNEDNVKKQRQERDGEHGTNNRDNGSRSD